MKIIDFLAKKPARFFLIAAFLWAGLMGILNYIRGTQWNDILVEANGMTFDLLVFGVLLSVYDAFREKKDKIERLHEEIDDYRFWDEKEATFRIVGAIKRLNKLDVTAIGLHRCFLVDANLSEANLSGSFLHFANLANASLLYVNLSGANLLGANLKGVALIGANLTGADLENALVDKDWFDELERFSVMGREAIKEKYFIDTKSRLRLKSDL